MKFKDKGQTIYINNLFKHFLVNSKKETELQALWKEVTPLLQKAY